MTRVRNPDCVTVFGAGITGLTVAHELIERGFRVQVWEPVTDARHPDRGCDVGGLARTQWGAVNWPENPGAKFVAPTPIETPMEWAKIGTRKIVELPQKFYFLGTGEKRKTQILAKKPVAFGATGQGTSEDVLDELLTTIETESRIDHIYCEVFDREFQKGRDDAEVRETAFQIQDQLKHLIKDSETTHRSLGKLVDSSEYIDQMATTLTFEKKNSTGKKADDTRVVTVNVTILDLEPSGLPKEVSVALQFRVRERWLAGEHGFRFFPAFYLHLFDTMKRTPILDLMDKDPLELAQERSVGVNPSPFRYIESGRRAFDNLVPTSTQGVAFGDKNNERSKRKVPAFLSRRPPKSFEELLIWVRTLVGSIHKDPDFDLPFGSIEGCSRDAAIFELRMLQFLTSCENRRKDYEDVSWLELLTGGEPPNQVFSSKFLTAVKDWPEALVALSATEADARTQGTVSAQLLLDNLRDGEFRDATLNGPTNLAWLNPWRRYLEAQGVEFIHGELESFDLAMIDGEERVWPKVKCYEPRHPGAIEGRPALLAGYFVVALPVAEAWKVARSYVRAVTRRHSAEYDKSGDLFSLARFPLLKNQSEAEDSTLGQDESALHTELGALTLTGELRHMIGIQYYFAEDLKWIEGHVSYPDAALRISSVSQARFWADKHDWEHGHRGVLSVIVTKLDTYGHDWPDANTLASDVWADIRASLPDRNLPDPLYWHVDEGFEVARQLVNSAEVRSRDANALQVQQVGSWSKRPGEAIEPEKDKFSAYTVENGIVLAGTYMKTFTRLTTMEAANESARHAVNAILDDFRTPPDKGGRPSGAVRTRTPCDIFPPEKREVPDFKFLIEIDEMLHGWGLDHGVDILGLPDLITHGLSGRPQDPIKLDGLLEALCQLKCGNLVDIFTRQR